MKNVYFETNPEWATRIGQIYALVERAKIAEERVEPINRLQLRKMNRVMTIQSSAAIEGNRLNVPQVTAIVDGDRVLGPPKDVQEVISLHTAYENLHEYNPYSVADFLRAHSLVTEKLVKESGKFRSVGVSIKEVRIGVKKEYGKTLHEGAAPKDVPRLITNLLNWAKETKEHPLIASSAVHFTIENIHPFRDGNGRTGRLWQTLMLTKFNPIFEWIPVETLIHYNQPEYYRALQKSHSSSGGQTTNCAPFIDFMLNVIESALYRFQDDVNTIATVADDELNVEMFKNEDLGTTFVKENDELDGVGNVTTNGGTNVTTNVTTNGGTNGGINLEDYEYEVYKLLQAKPTVTIKKMSNKLDLSERQTQRIVTKLKELGAIKRVGATKNGYWQVLKVAKRAKKK
ncbi:MAG: Fic family protein [Bifidobacteriaceae bacterium]|jgi:Fic family protein|nr:Fic family protein [Bifidobacteriaceae bacterium]